LTQNSTTGAPATPDGSVPADTAMRSSAPRASNCSPPARRMASTCAGRPISVTGAPARASMPP
jgi:hypothetical protein